MLILYLIEMISSGRNAIYDITKVFTVETLSNLQVIILTLYRQIDWLVHFNTSNKGHTPNTTLTHNFVFTFINVICYSKFTIPIGLDFPFPFFAFYYCVENLSSLSEFSTTCNTSLTTAWWSHLQIKLELF